MAACTDVQGALEIHNVTASEDVWEAGLRNLRKVQRYLLVQRCNGFRWSFMSALEEVGSQTAGVLLGQQFAVALKWNEGPAPINSTEIDALASGTIVIGGQIHVVSDTSNFCVTNDDAPFWWAANANVVLDHALSACDGQCYMFTTGCSTFLY